MLHSYTRSLLFALLVATCAYADDGPKLDQRMQQLFEDRLYQTNLRGPRWTGNDNQNVLTDAVSRSMSLAGLKVETLNYTIQRWDPRWWSLTLTLSNGTSIGLPTTGYWPYSGNSGLEGVTGPVVDAGTYGLEQNMSGDVSTLNMDGVVANTARGGASVLFFDNPSPTRNYSEPAYGLLGTSHDIDPSEIPELGNLTNPHWQSTKTLNFTEYKEMGVSAVIASWVNTSDENGALQYLPNDGAPGQSGLNLYDVPALYVGNSTGELIRELVRDGDVQSATVVLDAPSVNSTTHTVIGNLAGRAGSEQTILLYTHSDGPSIIEENGPILLLTIAEYFAQHPINISLEFVITTGHMSGGHQNESAWMGQRPEILQNAVAAVACEHFGAIQWKDDFSSGVPVYSATGRLEPMWTMANNTGPADRDVLHQVYIDAFAEADEDIRMALLTPQAGAVIAPHWYGVGGSSVLGASNIPTIGIIPQPDYLWAAMPDGGWSKLNISMAVQQIEIILRTIIGLDVKFMAGELQKA